MWETDSHRNEYCPLCTGSKVCARALGTHRWGWGGAGVGPGQICRQTEQGAFEWGSEHE